MTDGHIEVRHKDLDQFCRKNSISRLSRFGSVLTARFSDSSDVDVLVEFRPGRRAGYLRMAAMSGNSHGCSEAVKSTCERRAN